MSSVPQTHISVEEYLAREDRAEIKSEYYRGQVFAMSGGTRNHARIVGNIFGQLFSKLRGNPCRPASSDQRIYIPKIGLHTYPDVSVTCGPPQSEKIDPQANANPTLLVEVLSPSTEAYDRTHKFDFYKQLPSLQEYVLVSQSEARVEKFVRSENGGWTLFTALGCDSEISFESIDCRLSLADVYEGVELPPVNQQASPSVVIDSSRRPHA
jgi:Uma2 family endonuclease